MRKLFQEDFQSEPFWLVVACSMRSMCSMCRTWEMARPCFEKIRSMASTSEELYKLDYWEIVKCLMPLGQAITRANAMIVMASRWASAPPKDSKELAQFAGCGLFVIQSYQIFIENIEPVGDVLDEDLLWYLLNRVE